MNYKSILFFLGIYSLTVSFFSVLNVLYSFYFNFTIDLNSYLFCFLISSFIGILFCLMGRGYNKNITLSDQIFLILLTFLFIPLLISIPYFLSIYNISLLNSYFESVSGFTTTGFSIIENVETIDEPLLLWRSSSQWLGGLIFLIAIIGTLGQKQIKIRPNHLISSPNTGTNFYNNFNSNVIKIIIIYFLYTIFTIFLYNLLNIRLLDSFNLAFTAISSGGFLNKNNLSDIVTNDLQALVLSITLLLPIINFYLLFKIFTREFKLADHQEDLHLIIIIILLTLLFYFFIVPNETVTNILLAITTSLSTSGIAIYSSNFDVSLSFILLTIIGGSLISTSSGLKYIRIYILLKTSYQEMYRLVKPKNIFNRNLFNSDSKINDEDSKIAFLVFITFIISIFVLSSVLTLDHFDFEESFKLSLLTLTNTVNSELYELNNISFYSLNNFTKIILIFFMVLAKIEIIAILFLVRKFIFRE